jgi:hypothetical protein
MSKPFRTEVGRADSLREEYCWQLVETAHNTLVDYGECDSWDDAETAAFEAMEREVSRCPNCGRVDCLICETMGF